METRWRLTIVSSVLLSGDHGLGVKKRPVGAAFNLVNASRLEIDVERAGDVFAGTRL